MMTTTLIAAAQLESSPSAEENLAKARSAIALAAQRGARLVILPEIFMAYLSHEEFTAPQARRVAQSLDGPFVTGLREAARTAQVWVVAGMIEVAGGTEEKTYNTTVVIDGQGELLRAYHKTHMFDAYGYRESDVFVSGDQLFEPLATPFGRMGLFVCYELRFPEVARYQAARGVDFFVVPSGWVNGHLKEVHWRHLVVARAIENTAYVFTCDQAGHQFLGRSLHVDPLGVVLAEGSEGEQLVFGEFDPQRLEQARIKVPALQHRRPDLYR
ncbi:carbon-nitrogen hydrolase family protein [Thermogemmatispora sp.]|uniref:carbon-nitrogen hydrolase family protein n=1 Tax=Thermogemmatispora sp. TaxID=1968838 RepID=UPI002637DB79|nr:carbon-nitrogen hydrolase family protein [Thermogemmatispora sp.]